MFFLGSEHYLLTISVGSEVVRGTTKQRSRDHLPQEQLRVFCLRRGVEHRTNSKPVPLDLGFAK